VEPDCTVARLVHKDYIRSLEETGQRSNELGGAYGTIKHNGYIETPIVSLYCDVGFSYTYPNVFVLLRSILGFIHTIESGGEMRAYLCLEEIDELKDYKEAIRVMNWKYMAEEIIENRKIIDITGYIGKYDIHIYASGSIRLNKDDAELIEFPGRKDIIATLIREQL
jgi:hypothetical protein